MRRLSKAPYLVALAAMLWLVILPVKAALGGWHFLGLTLATAILVASFVRLARDPDIGPAGVLFGVKLYASGRGRLGFRMASLGASYLTAGLAYGIIPFGAEASRFAEVTWPVAAVLLVGGLVLWFSELVTSL